MTQPTTVEPPPQASAAASPVELISRSASRPATPYRIHLLCYGILSCLFGYAVVARYMVPLWSPPPISVSTAEPGATTAPLAALDQRIDPNLAGWVELTRLPGIGEVLAKRIVAFREERQSEAGNDGAVFRSLEDLGAVRGIGDKTLDRLAPYLKFGSCEPPSSDHASQSENAGP